MSNFSDWPACGECMAKRPDLPFVPVEEYELIPEGVLIGAFRVVVVAKCSHGRGFRGDTVKTQHSTIDVPVWWNLDPAKPLSCKHLVAAVRTLRFFVPGAGAPQHRMVTLVH